MGNQFSQSAYIPVLIEDLISGKEFSGPLYLYFEQNQHLVLRYKSAKDIEAGDLKRYQSHGIKWFWSPREYQGAVRQGGSADIPDKIQLSREAIAEIKAQNRGTSKKEETLRRVGTEMIAMIAAVGSDKTEGADELKKCREISEEITAAIVESHEMSNLYEDLKMVQALDAGHSATVSMFTTMFALALGYSDQEVLADLAFGALLNDIGYVRLNPDLFRIPEAKYTKEQWDEYKSHVAKGLQLLEQKKVELTPAVKRIIEQHHEYFDGSGYPKGIRGFEIHETSQIVGLSSQMDDLLSGRIDGEKRGPSEALELLKESQHQPGAVIRYEPQIFLSVVQAIERGQTLAESRERQAGEDLAKAAVQRARQAGSNGREKT